MQQYFTTPFGFVFLGIFLVLGGVMFTIYNLLGGNADFAGTFDLMKNLSFLLFPILTMRLFAEERRAGTEMLLVASKLSMKDIVLGKFFAASSVFLAALLTTLVYVGIVSAYGAPNMGSVLASYLGFFLLGLCMISICLFIASFAENQVTAAVASFGTLFFLMILASFTKSLNIPVLTPVLSAIAITTRFDDFTLGILRIGPIVYYAGVTLIFLLLAIKNMEKRRFQ